MSTRTFTLRSLLAVLVALAPCVLPAQFNGPADTARDTVNAPHTLTVDPAILYPPARNPLLQTGDLLKISIAGITDYAATDRVSAEGAVSLPLLRNIIPLEGLTIVQAQKAIADRYIAASIFVDPQVRIEITESPKSVVTLMGEVRSVQQLPSGNKRLFDVLASAGGLPTTASHLISIDRPGLVESINVDVGTDPERSKYANIPVFAGDTITTGSIGRCYLLGAFKVQGPFSLTSTAPLTLMQLVSLSGGKLFAAKIDQIHIIRTIGTQRTVVTVNLKAALNGSGPDPVVQSDDIIIAPTSLLRSAISQGGVQTIFGIGLTLFTLLRN